MFPGGSSNNNQPRPGGGIPSHMDDDQRIILNTGSRGGRGGHGPRAAGAPGPGLEEVERGTVTMFTENLSATIGPAYVSSFLIGGLIGIARIPPQRSRRTTKLMINSYLNSVGKTSAKFGNNVGGAILMYMMVGKTIDFIFKEEMEDFNISIQNGVYGALTGALYKSTRGKRAMALGGILGAILGSGYAHLWYKGYLKYTI